MASRRDDDSISGRNEDNGRETPPTRLCTSVRRPWATHVHTYTHTTRTRSQIFAPSKWFARTATHRGRLPTTQLLGYWQQQPTAEYSVQYSQPPSFRPVCQTRPRVLRPRRIMHRIHLPQISSTSTRTHTCHFGPHTHRNKPIHHTTQHCALCCFGISHGSGYVPCGSRPSSERMQTRRRTSAHKRLLRTQKRHRPLSSLNRTITLGISISVCMHSIEDVRLLWRRRHLPGRFGRPYLSLAHASRMEYKFI